MLFTFTFNSLLVDYLGFLLFGPVLASCGSCLSCLFIGLCPQLPYYYYYYLIYLFFIRKTYREKERQRQRFSLIYPVKM